MGCWRVSESYGLAGSKWRNHRQKQNRRVGDPGIGDFAGLGVLLHVQKPNICTPDLGSGILVFQGRKVGLMRRRVVTYVRMSTEKQTASPEQQRAEIAKTVKAKRYQVVAAYEDLAKSGGDAAKRPQFRKMVAAAERGEFDTILVFDRSRFGRFDSVDAGEWLAPLRRAGVTIETVVDGQLDWDSFGGRVTALVQAEVDYQHLVATSRATVRGQTSKAQAADGYPGGPPPYGYRRVPVKRAAAAAGKSTYVTELAVDPETAPKAKRVFELYASGLSFKGVATQLNKEGIPSPNGGIWHKTSVMRVLGNPVYTGTYQWGLRQTGKFHAVDGKGGRTKRKPTDRMALTTPIQHRDAVPRLITDELYERVQKRVAANRRETANPGTKKPLSGCVYCETCGKPMRADGKCFRCASSEGTVPTDCPSYRTNGDDLLAAVVDTLKSEIGTPSSRRDLRAALEKAVGARAGDDQAAKDLAKRLKEIELEIRQGTARMAKLPEAAVDAMVEHLRGLQAQRDAVAADLSKLESRSTGRLGAKRLVDDVLKNADELLDRLKAGGGDPETVNRLVKAAGVEVHVTPVSAKERKGTRKGWLKVFVPLVTCVATIVVDRHTGISRVKRRPHLNLPFLY